MKKLLLILALLAYAAISCDKPETTNDEPKTEQPANPEQPADSSFNPGEPSEPEDTIAFNADTCQIGVITSLSMATFIYNVSSEDVDFADSINSIFKHYTITLKDGSTPTWIGTNCRFREPYSSDTGMISFVGSRIWDSLPYGHYIAITWDCFANSTWGPNHYDPELQCLYHDIVLDENHPSEIIQLDNFIDLLRATPFLSFTKY